MKNTLKSIVISFAIFATQGVIYAENQNSDIEQALLDWSESKDPKAVHASIDFNTVMRADEVIHISEEYGLQPYAVFMSLGDQNGIHRVSPYIADSSVVTEAITKTKEQKEQVLISLKKRAKFTRKSMQEINKATNNGKGKGKNSSTTNDKDEQLETLRSHAKAILERRHSEVKARNALKADPQIIYGLVFVASDENIRNLANSYEVNVGVIINERIVVPHPTHALVPDDVSFEELSDAELNAALNSTIQGE